MANELLLIDEEYTKWVQSHQDGVARSAALCNRLAQLAKAKPIIIREEQRRNAGALRILFEKGWTLNDLIQAEDTMEEEYTNIAEEAKKQERERIIEEMRKITVDRGDYLTNWESVWLKFRQALKEGK